MLIQIDCKIVGLDFIEVYISLETSFGLQLFAQ